MNLTSFRPDLSVEDLAKLARDATGYAQLKMLEEQILAARRELDDRLEAIMRAKSGFENWMNLEHGPCPTIWRLSAVARSEAFISDPPQSWRIARVPLRDPG